jgi:hypothetical protein
MGSVSGIEEFGELTSWSPGACARVPAPGVMGGRRARILFVVAVAQSSRGRWLSTQRR